MGGELSVESEPDKGSTFSFTATLREQCAPAAQEATQGSSLRDVRF